MAAKPKITIPRNISEHDINLVKSIRYLAADKRIDDYSYQIFFYSIIEKLEYVPRKC